MLVHLSFLNSRWQLLFLTHHSPCVLSNILALICVPIGMLVFKWSPLLTHCYFVLGEKHWPTKTRSEVNCSSQFKGQSIQTVKCAYIRWLHRHSDCFTLMHRLRGERLLSVICSKYCGTLLINITLTALLACLWFFTPSQMLSWFLIQHFGLKGVVRTIKQLSVISQLGVVNNEWQIIDRDTDQLIIRTFNFIFLYYIRSIFITSNFIISYLVWSII